MESCKPFSQALISSISSTSMTEPDNSRNEAFQCSSERPNSVSELAVKPQQVVDSPNGVIGSLEIFIHQARDIQNICIYHKQDVYAKLYLTNNPESAISTKIINGGGRNPIFNESASLNVVTIDSSLKCEIWMLSRAKNYLGDQLLGFALVPLSEVIGYGKLAQEFSLSSTDLFHSPSGYVQLSLSYNGSLPEVMVIAKPVASAIEVGGLKNSAIDDSIPCEYEKIEFPDLKVVNENKMMVSEYFGIPCNNLDSQNSDDCSDNSDKDAGVKIVESFSTENNHDSFEFLGDDTPLSCVSSDVSSLMAPTTSEAIAEPLQLQKSKETEVAEDGSVSSNCRQEKAYVKPLIEVNIEPEQPVVQQEIVDIYMKSMQEFTESLANMKLPMDIENSSSIDNGNVVSGKKLQEPKNGSGRVFYGSRAFF
ncbi:uncharacterized protein LOC110099397 [Dendrobium catenatum]|uniref:C2 domain-containing protein n=1 Tax=Dendrobium catenatum TaxID=906689 RepID=A0A2I0W4K9_9ASPA|nr:uncharacterized protein LOC110099397 [Dendrobium catenatum]XP_020682185.1 uncharacterized protein LOC110099397 [Dendrobium catenatum]XP_020682186.1 uncharacterized protein LOC110099397 [Dendrobium catenatum]XP_028554390.1 uncharacterized protein LOC110099397 [Dendrobium catenatum]PKU70582.1 hypothetical protein MA16_Dca008699 [Dendrobium catenatum]